MGTSNSSKGPGPRTPLVPSWLGDPGPKSTPPDIPPQRFRYPKGEFTRFINSGGHDRHHLGRALSDYVTNSTGGAANAARRMGAATVTASSLLHLLSNIRDEGAEEALKTLNLEGLAHQPIQKVFEALADALCPDGGRIDEGIAREAFSAVLGDLDQLDIKDLEDIEETHIESILETFIWRSIELRILNDIGIRIVDLPTDAKAVQRIESEVGAFVQGAVRDAIAHELQHSNDLSAKQAQRIIEKIYSAAFELIRAYGEREDK